MTPMESVSLLRSTFEKYSDLHDGELMSLRLEATELEVRFSAENYVTELWEDVAVRFISLRRFQLSQPNGTDIAFRDYVFPVSRLVDGVSISTDGTSVLITIFGTYGWQLQIDCESIAMP
jgi:hypothetical protein